MNAWHQHTLGGDGKVVSMAKVPALQGGRDELWLAVRREVDGQTVHYIETLEPGHEYGEDVTECFFVDSGLTFQGNKLTEISGLAHLEGHTVHILANGGVQPAQVVKNGRVPLQYPAEKVHVGLPYCSRLTTVDFDANLPDGTAKARIKRTVKVHLQLIESAGGSVGDKDDRLVPMEYWTAPRPMGKAPGLYTGLQTVSWPGGYETDGSVTVIQDLPLPFLLSGIIQELQIEGLN